MPKHPKLSPTEKRVALWVCRGKTPAQIAADLGIALGTCRVHLSHVRNKSGVLDLNPEKLAKHLEESNQVEGKARLGMTAAQRAVLVLVAQGKTYAHICAALNLAYMTAVNHACQGCKRLGISGTGLARQLELRSALGMDEEKPAPPTMEDPFFN